MSRAIAWGQSTCRGAATTQHPGECVSCGVACASLVALELWAEQDHWKVLLADPKMLRELFSPPTARARPYDQRDFALEARSQNTLPPHLEWQRKAHPQAIVQPISEREMLIATLLD